jgi:hypothetical protein
MNAVTSAYLARIWLDERDRRYAGASGYSPPPRRGNPRPPRKSGRRWRVALASVIALAACTWFVSSASAGGAFPQTLHVSVSGSGTVVSSPEGINCGSTCSHIYSDPTAVTLIAAPDPGWYFAGWSGGDCGSADVCRLDLNSGDTWVNALFLQDLPSPPETMITAGPGSMTHDATPTFHFSSSEQASSFLCTIDSSAPAACDSQEATVDPLSDGSHTFAVQAVGAGGPDPTPATRTFTVSTAAVGVVGTTLTVTAAPQARDNLKITRPSPTEFQVTDAAAPGYAGSGVHALAGCARSGDATAICSAASVDSIKVVAGDLADRVVNTTATSSSISGGAGSDGLIGGPGVDTITGGGGADTLMGLGGDDVLQARDFNSDLSLDCTAGTHDKVVADQLPSDPGAIVKKCETVVRR